MLYREIIAVYSEVHTKHINALCGQNTEFLNVKAEGKRPLGRPRRRWEDNIKMDLQEVGWGWLKIGTGGGHL